MTTLVEPSTAATLTSPDPTDPPPPPEEPPTTIPAGVVHDLLWRVAARMYREHRPLRCDHECPHRPVDPGQRICRSCHEPWPCSGRRLAELALSAAAR